MKHIQDNTAHAAATAHLAQLRAAEVTALQDEAAAIAQLDDPKAQPESALTAAGRLLRGEPAIGVDLASQAARLADARQRLRLLGAAIVEQQSVIAEMRATLSVAACAAAAPTHLEAAAGIVAALQGLRAALAAEVALRAAIVAAGYACSFEPLAVPELNFDDPQSPACRLLRDIARHIEVQRLRSGKAVSVLLLVDVPGIGGCGDVVRIEGPAAAGLVAVGRAEVTTAKPGRVTHYSAPADLVLS